MSAYPSGQSIGPTSNNKKPQFIRRSRAIDPLRPRKKPLRRPPHLDPPKSLLAESKLFYPVNGLAPQKKSLQQQACDQLQESNDGWTNEPEGEYCDFPLITTKKAVREGLRYHIARFAGKKEVDPWNQNEFTRPVVLHRRDPQQPSGRGSKDDEFEADQAIDSKEREKQEIARAEKEKQRVLDLAQIAPTGNNPSLASKKIIPGRNEKTTQVYRLDKTLEEKKASDLRYEEALPWHIEDADNKNTWVGNYEAALSDINVAFIIQDGVFKMIPLEKWYKFASKGQFKAYTIDEAEAKMGKKVKESRWVMKENEQKEADRVNLEGRKAMVKLYTVKSESTTFRNSGKREVEDMDELDFNGDDLFQDDDELATVEPDKDEESKEAQDRIKKEQLGANFFGQANEAEVDQELFEEEKEAQARKKLGKGVKKALKKRERNYIYDSDSDHPYSETSEDDTSDEEKVKEIDRRLEEENKNKMKTENKSVTSTTITKDVNFPAIRSRDNDLLKKPHSRKRPGSPNLSESSGNESTRKKSKKKHAPNLETSDPKSESRQTSFGSQSSTGPVDRYNTTFKINSSQARASDAYSALTTLNPNSDSEAMKGDLSDRAKKRQKLKVSATNVSSRAGPRQCSPVLVTSPHGTQRSGPITTSEIVSALPTTGISIGNLMKSFGGRVGDDPAIQTKKAEFIRLVRENAKYGPDKLLRPK
ncbi:Transcription initiation factor IIF subunit alpha [Golovinomyces cichoracearum]|uniref:Transcription initiation factor IIF subunit alpha n=1 Tax=Golovinomyces cichoracearum TaxID=62708 RepID=A0A420I086_9PEZI|nr:Transcription initiation factor IIF subunit alpha [Golovinomyces cichoracearum]